MKNIQKLSLSLLIISASTTFFSYSNDKITSSDLKLRVINTMDVMSNSDAGQDVSKDIEKIRQEKFSQLRESQEAVTQEIKNFQAKAPMLKKEELNKEEIRVSNLQKEHEYKVKAKEEEFKLEVQQKTDEISQKIVDAVKDYAQSQKIDLVLDVRGTVIYASEDDRVNATEEVKKLVNSSYAQEKKLKLAQKKTEDTKVATTKKNAKA